MIDGNTWGIFQLTIFRGNGTDFELGEGPLLLSRAFIQLQLGIQIIRTK